ncbi:MAG: translocation/assembly module TamB domain-containing protein [Deltaproteobacteria bacterium]|nr:translocation/assembly module TamB domain-containing protein [Deltaproteobacteria bacterium]
MKRWRVVSLLLLPLLIVLAGLAFLGLTETGFRQLVGMAVDLSGGVLAVENVQGRLLGKWQLDGLRLQTPAADLSCKKIVAQWQPLALFRGTVRIVTVHGEGIDVLIKEEGQGYSSFPLPEILLPVEVALATFELNDVSIHGMAGMELPRIEQISLELATRRNHVILKRAEVRIPGGSAHMQGIIGLGGKWPLDLRGGWRMEKKGAGLLAAPVAADFVIRGTLNDLVAQVDLQTPVKTRVNLACSDPFGALRWQADTILSQVKLAEVHPSWPDLVLESGDIRASGTRAGYQGTAQLQGAWNQSESRLPLASQPQTQVHAEFTGDSNGLWVSLVAQLPAGTVTDKDVLKPQEPGTQGGESTVLPAPGTDKERPAGAVTARAAVGWRDGLHWQIELTGKDMNPGAYFPDWQGHINTRINISGRLQDEALQGEMQLAALDGDLLGYPLSGSGSVSVDEDGAQVKEFVLRSGESELAVTGTVGAGVKDGAGATSTLDLRVQLDSANLGNLLPEAGGTAHLKGSVQGSREAPEFSFELDAGKLFYGDTALQALTGSGQGIFGPQGAVNVNLAGKGLRAGNTEFGSLIVDLGGTMARHQVQAKLTGPAGDMDLVLAGGLTAQTWQGEIRDLLLRLDPYGKWQLQSPAPMRIDGKGVDPTSVCLQQGEAKLCLQGGWHPSRDNGSGDGQWWLDANLDSFACNLLYQWHLLPYSVEGKLAALVRTAGVGARLVTMEGRFSVPEVQLAIQNEDGEEQILRWTDNLLDLKLVGDKLVSMAKSRFQDGSALDAMISIGGFGDLSASWAGLPIQGEIGLDVKDLAPVAVLSNYTVKPTGSMKGTFAVQGRVGNPHLIGELRQIQGNVFIPATGITLENLLLSVMAKGEEEGMHLVLDAVSGPGKIRIAGDLTRDMQKGWLADATATGKEFEVAHLPDYAIFIDPDLHFAWRAGMMQVSGKVLVPRASVTIKEVEGSVTASHDIVVVDSGEAGEKKDLPLQGSVIVELGPDVRVNAFGLKGQLLGSVTVSVTPGLPLTGKGSLTMHDGIFIVRDRALDIYRGRFFFLSGPLDNPGIDVLAQKKNNDKTVGVLASGTVNDMDLKLFSDPPMAEDAVLRELLAGRSYSGTTSHQVSNTIGAVATGLGLVQSGTFVEDILSRLENQFALNDIYVESGEKSSDVSLMVGKELSKDLYISYGYDPFTSAGIFKARYDLWKGFSVETEVGADKTGADLLWSIEK